MKAINSYVTVTSSRAVNEKENPAISCEQLPLTCVNFSFTPSMSLLFSSLSELVCLIRLRVLRVSLS